MVKSVSRPEPQPTPVESEDQILQDLAERLSYQLTDDELLDQLLDTVCQVLPHEVSGYFLGTDELGKLAIRHCQTLGWELQQHLQQHVFDVWHLLKGSTISRYQVRTQSSPILTTSNPLHALGSLLCLPLVIAETEELIGLLFVGAEPDHAYTETQVQFLGEVAKQGAIALRRLRVIQSVQQRRLYSIVEHLPDGVVLLDHEGNIVLANQAAWKYIAILTKTGCAEVFWQLSHVLIERKVCHELLLDNQPLVLEFTTQPMPTGQTHPDWLLIVRDITERKQTETGLVQDLQALSSCNHELQHFASVAAHDLQAPLMVVSGYLEVLEKSCKGQLDSRATRFINQAVDGTKRMQLLIEDLLSYAQLSAPPSELTQVNCKDLIDQAIANLQTAIATTQAALSYPEQLPTLQGHPTQLIQLFQNLVSNAIKYQPADQTPKVEIEVEPQETHWKFTIRDNGIGIDPQAFEQIFRPFHRLNGYSEYPGTGIGLAIAKKIVEYHQGQIWVESIPGHGSAFHFTLIRQ